MVINLIMKANQPTIFYLTNLNKHIDFSNWNISKS